jgi:pyruvate dehydrogenase E2 component (dihydrolipoamide acetyltransferase)
MSGKAKITPRARRAAEEHGLDMGSLAIEGTGFDGGITEADILAWLASNDTEKVARATPLARRIARAEGVDISTVIGTGAGGKATKADVLGALTSSPRQAEAGAELRPEARDGKTIRSVTPYKGVRKIIGERLAMSKFTAPHLYFTQKVDLSELLALRKTVNEKQEKKTSVTDYVAKACVISLQKFPEMNSALAGDRIETNSDVNLGNAVASPTGLIVPVIRNAQGMSVVEISKAASPLFERAREGKLKPDEYAGGTFTVSNLGMFGIENFTAIINPPEVGILAVSATKDEPAVVESASGEKTIAIRPLMYITLRVDHRLIDGLLAARFVTEVKRLLESPIELLI